MKDLVLFPEKSFFKKGLYVDLTVFFFILIAGVLVISLASLSPEVHFFVVLEIFLFLWVLVLIVVSIVVLPLFYLWVKSLQYIIGNERIIIKKGFITKIEQNIPFKSVTDFMLQRTIFDRILGIGSIRVQTAGQNMNSVSGFEGILHGIKDYDSILAELRLRIETVMKAVDTGAHDNKEIDVRHEILNELKKIREHMEKENRR